MGEWGGLQGWLSVGEREGGLRGNRGKTGYDQDATTNQKLYSHGVAAYHLAIGHNRHPIAEIYKCFLVTLS